MGSIRVGYFEAFKGADTLLIDIDAEGLRDLIVWGSRRHFVRPEGPAERLSQCKPSIRTSSRGLSWSR
jgi:hypothetical protein